MNQKNKNKTIFTTLVVVAMFFLLITQVNAQPAGLEISGNVTETALVVDPANRTDDGGTITTLVVDVLQQNRRWKAYLGNLTGTLTLDDANGQSIFRWEMEAQDTTGNIFITRSNTINWATVSCPDNATIENEDTTLGFTNTSVDTINRTFNETTHPELNIGIIDILEDTCRSTSTFVNNTKQAQNTADFPLILLSSGTDLIYANPLNKGADSFITGTKTDFQVIVPDQTIGTTTYYFYAEIGV